jgi:23S rRNA pseudouridine2605 synthase
VASRRRAEALIAAGRVSVNGAVVRELGARADPRRDTIVVDGEPVRVTRERRWLVLHKPRGVVSTLADPEGRPTVADLLAGVGRRVYPVGRLDVNSTGLLLLTDDGELAARLAHPRHEVARVYHAKVRGGLDPAALSRLRRGVRLEDGRTAPARVRILERLPTKTWLELTVREGRSHLVRRMCDAVGHPVEKLARVRLGPIGLGTLPAGAWRDLSPREAAALAAAVGLRRGAGDGRAARSARGRRAPRTPPRTSPPPPAGSRGGGARDGAPPKGSGRGRAPDRRPRPRRP